MSYLKLQMLYDNGTYYKWKAKDDHHKPLLSALVIMSGDNYQGDGFYKLAESLGYGNWQRLKRDGVFEVQQINECIKFWTDNIKPNKTIK